MKNIELFNDHFQNYKVYGIPKAQLVIADIPYNIGKDAYESYATEDFIQPIELTEEVLLKIGFIHRIGMFHFQIIEENKKIEVYYNPPIGGLVAYKDEKYKEFEKIEKFGIRYLHELQNAYYLLTNEELEVEL